MATMAFTADHAMQLLDFSKKLDIGLLDGVVDCFYNGMGDDVSAVDSIGMAWSLEFSSVVW